jgi:hypothetical protein
MDYDFDYYGSHPLTVDGRLDVGCTSPFQYTPTVLRTLSICLPFVHAQEIY